MKRVSSSDIKSILQNYAVGNLQSFRLLKGGVENLNVVITTTKGKYVLRLHREAHSFRTKNYVIFELDLIDFLRRRGFPIPQVIRMTDGERIFDFKATHGVLFSFEEGKHILRKDLWQVKEIGKVLGRLHKFTRNLSINHAPYRKIITKEKIQKYVKENLHYLEKQLPRTAKEISYLAKSKELGVPSELPSGCVHVDLHDENVLFGGKKISAVLDWDDSFHGPFILDVGSAMRLWCAGRKKIDYKRVRCLIQSYETERKLQESEKKALKKSCFTVILWHTSYLMQPQHIEKPRILPIIKNSAIFLKNLIDTNEQEFYEKVFGK